MHLSNHLGAELPSHYGNSCQGDMGSWAWSATVKCQNLGPVEAEGHYAAIYVVRVMM